MLKKNYNFLPIKKIIKKYNLVAKKSLGQNYILDPQILLSIVKSLGNLSKYIIFEIGPGPGGLTRLLLELGAKYVIIIEKDKRFIDPLIEIKKYYSNKLKIIIGDILNIDLFKLIKKNQKIKIISNLPYNISTKVIIKLVTNSYWPPIWKQLTFTIQYEVANRILAKQNNKNYCRLTVLMQWRTYIKKIFDLHPNIFRPKPKVFSTLINIYPRYKPMLCNIKTLQKVTKIMFNQRRKMIKSSLKPLLNNSNILLSQSYLSPQLRAENLTIKDFVYLSNLYDKFDK